MKRRINFNSWLTIGSLIALGLATIVGSLLNGDTNQVGLFFSEALGKLWVIILLVLVIPLVCTYVFHTVVTMGQSKAMASLGFHAVKTHIFFLATSVVFTLIVGWLLLISFDASLGNLIVGTTEEVMIVPDNHQAGRNYDQILSKLTDIQQYFGQAVLSLMFLSLLLGIAAAYGSIDLLLKWVNPAQLLGHKAMSWLSNYFITLPIAVFFLVLPLIAQEGFAVIGVALYFVVMLCFLLFIFTLLIYLVVYAATGIGPVSFGRGIFHAQVTALSTRSSMATIPAMILACGKAFDIQENIATMVIPFFTTIFRLNKGISSIFKFLFLSYVYSLPIEPTTLLMFVSVQMLVSFGTPGIPSGSKFMTLPIYMAAGIPMEGYILLKAVDAIPDIFKTVLNITEVMAIVLMVKGKLKALI